MHRAAGMQWSQQSCRTWGWPHRCTCFMPMFRFTALLHPTRVLAMLSRLQSYKSTALACLQS